MLGTELIKEQKRWDTCMHLWSSRGEINKIIPTNECFTTNSKSTAHPVYAPAHLDLGEKIRSIPTPSKTTPNPGKR